jgi:ABC-type multidrug transport system fused ATPase/permease subunit
MASARIRAVYRPLVELIGVSGALVVMGFGTWKLAQGQLTLGGLLVFPALIGKLYSPIRDLSRLGTTFYAASASAERTSELLDQCLAAAADVWGIGITLCELAAGDVPFERGETVEETYGTGTSEADDHAAAGQDDWYPQPEASAPPIASRRRLPRALAAAVDTCLWDDPPDRPLVRELAEVLGATLADQGLRADHR